MAEIRVQAEDFDVGIEIARVGADDDGVGGVATFLGVVRGGDGPDAVRAMTLEHWPGMCEAALGAIAAEAEARWALRGVLVIHRYGRLVPGDRIVLVAVASAHRHDAFEACRFLADWLKTRAPFWKREETASGERWVAARESDDAAAARWNHAASPRWETEQE